MTLNGRSSSKPHLAFFSQYTAEFSKFIIRLRRIFFFALMARRRILCVTGVVRNQLFNAESLSVSRIVVNNHLCTAYQIGWLIKVKVDLDHIPLHSYIFITIRASNKQLSVLIKLDNYNYFYQQNTLGTFSLTINYNSHPITSQKPKGMI